MMWRGTTNRTNLTNLSRGGELRTTWILIWGVAVEFGFNREMTRKSAKFKQPKNGVRVIRCLRVWGMRDDGFRGFDGFIWKGFFGDVWSEDRISVILIHARLRLINS